jgi:predicted nucleic acid-binding protein
MLTIDSNIWAYYFDDQTLEHKYVVKPLEEALSTEEIAINTVIIMEVAHFLIKSLGPVAGKEKLKIFLSYAPTVTELTYEVALKAIDLLAEYSHLGIGGRDATLLASMEQLTTTKIMTHDEAFKHIPSIETIDPIPKQPRV